MRFCIVSLLAAGMSKFNLLLRLCPNWSFESSLRDVQPKGPLMNMLMKNKPLLALLLGVSSAASAASVMTTRLDDPRAIYLTGPEFAAHGDGKTDDSAAIQ